MVLLVSQSVMFLHFLFFYVVTTYYCFMCVCVCVCTEYSFPLFVIGFLIYMFVKVSTKCSLFLFCCKRKPERLTCDDESD
jgi:hypothetical protein